MLNYWYDARHRHAMIAGIILALFAPLLVACGGTPTTTTPSPTGSTAGVTPTRASALTATALLTHTTALSPTAATLPTSTPPSPATTVTRTSTALPGTGVRASATAATPSVDASAIVTGDTARFTRGGLDGTVLNALAVGGRDGQILFAGGRGLWRSTDGGKNWEAVRSAAEAPRVTSLAIAPSDQQTVYVGVGQGCGRGDRTPGLVSTDGGAHWRESGQNISSLAIDPFDARKVWATTCAGVQRSKDGGANWEAAPRAQLDGYTPVQIALVQGTPSVVYAAYASEGGTAKVRRTIDDGATWQGTQLPAAAFGPLSLATDPAKADSVYLSTLVGVFRSLDGGQNWTLLTDGLEATKPARPPANAPDGFRLTTAIAAAPNVSDTVWVGTGAGTTKGIGVFGTRDAGATWRNIGAGIEGRTIQGLAVGATRNRIIVYVATDDGVWLLNTPQQ